MDARIERIFESALAVPQQDRQRSVTEACGGDKELASQVMSLLGAHERAKGFLADPPSHAATDPQAESAHGASVTPARSVLGEGPGSIIGHYKLLQVIGEGGFGVVFMAEQLEPIRRRVALKIIKLGMDTQQVIARFELERQALAMMDHPGIARVLDAGTTSTGRPYFVMELVPGQPIVEYCDRHEVSTVERLQLILGVCRAVQHAHHKGIIHRDIKPSNVLVTMQDGSPVPKVIDFGIAKAVNQRLTERTLFTEFNQMIGTPEYMSPEQADMPGLDIDTRTDVYSLGVVLYELLVGSTPFEGKSLRSKGYAEMQRIIREDEPPAPSTRFATLGQSQAKVAKSRHSDVESLRRTLRGELDHIVMKCLEKDRTRRYETPSALADDLARYLANEPILAAPPSIRYKLDKFIRRNKRLFAAGVAIAAWLLLGLVGFAYQANRVGIQRDRAVNAEIAAKTERDRAVTVTQFFVESMESQDPNQTGQTDMTVAEAMARAADGLAAGKLKDQPAAAATLWRTIAYILDANGRSVEAEGPAVQALRIDRSLHPGDDPELAASLLQLSSVLRSLGRLAEADPLGVEAVEMQQRILGDDPEVEGSLTSLGQLRMLENRAAEAEPLFVRALEMNQRIHRGDHPDVATNLNNLAQVRQAMGRLAEAESLQVKALEMDRRLFQGDHPSVATALNNVARVRQEMGHAAEAEPLQQQALEMNQRIYKGDHRNIAAALMNLAYMRDELGRPADAEPLYRQCLEMNKRLFPGDHLDLVKSLRNLGNCESKLGRLPEALTLVQQSVDMAARLLPPDHPTRLKCDEVLAGIKKKIEDAEALPSRAPSPPPKG